MRSLVALLLSLVSLSSTARAEGDFCRAVPRLEALGQTRCANFDQFSDPEVRDAQRGCIAYYDTVKKAAATLCELGSEVDALDAGNRGLPAVQVRVRNLNFYRTWSFRLLGGPRRDLEIAFANYKKVISGVNAFGLELLREEASTCGRPGSAPSPAYIGLALSAGYEAAHVHKFMGEIFSGLGMAMSKQAQVRDALRARDPGEAGPAPEPKAPEAEHEESAATPAVKVILGEAIQHVLHQHGLQGLGIHLADKLLVSQKLDALDLVVLATKALVITAGGMSAGPTVGISLGIGLAINGAIDYLEFAIRSVQGSFERLANARMDELLTFHRCQVAKNRHLGSAELSLAYHSHRRDGLCGASCADVGLFGMCRPSVVFTADRCE